MKLAFGNVSLPQLMLQVLNPMAGVLYPRTKASGTSGDWKSMGLFLEQWNYGLKAQRDSLQAVMLTRARR